MDKLKLAPNTHELHDEPQANIMPWLTPVMFCMYLYTVNIKCTLYNITSSPVAPQTVTYVVHIVMEPLVDTLIEKTTHLYLHKHRSAVFKQQKALGRRGLFIWFLSCKNAHSQIKETSISTRTCLSCWPLLNLFYEASEGHLIPLILINNAVVLQLQMTSGLSGFTF